MSQQRSDWSILLSLFLRVDLSVAESVLDEGILILESSGWEFIGIPSVD